MRFGLYLHVPFCLQRCDYCDFFTMPILEERDVHFEPYMKAITKEFEQQAPAFSDRKLSTLFLGGGTPSLLKPQELESLLELARKHFQWEDSVEITLEINPETIDLEKAQAFRQIGVNRASMGVQSLEEHSLKILGRVHSVSSARRCYDNLRKAGFDNISLDFIYGRPDQTVEAWEKELDLIHSWGAQHLSMYELILEPGTPMTRAVRKGELTLPKEDERLQMFRLAREKSREHGLEWYEVSNYAIPGLESRHNLENWLGAEYLGLGPGAHSFRAKPGLGARRANPRNMPLYLEAPSVALWQGRDLEDVHTECLMNGLRVRDGFEPSVIKRLYGIDLEKKFGSKLPELRSAGYLEPGDERWCLTERGAELLDSILAYLSHS